MSFFPGISSSIPHVWTGRKTELIGCIVSVQPYVIIPMLLNVIG